MSLDQEPIIEDTDDSDDEDYVFTGGENLPSEEDSDGEPEDDVETDEDVAKPGRKRKGSRKQGGSKKSKGRKKGRDTVEVTSGGSDEESKKPLKPGEEDDKQKTDSLWADFLKDAGSPLTKQTAISGTSSKDSKEVDPKTELRKDDKQQKVVTVTKVFQFAGEEFNVTKEVPADSVEAQISTSQEKSSGAVSRGSRGPGISVPSKGGRKSTDGGLSSILSQIGKKNKIGTLEKSKIDWEQFKKSEGLEEDIQVHNRGKAGYLERQDFLQRADLRQFQIEKDMRTKRRSNR